MNESGKKYFCKDCGAELNIQAGFRTDRGVWNCLECGFENLLNTEDFQKSPHMTHSSSSAGGGYRQADYQKMPGSEDSHDNYYQKGFYSKTSGPDSSKSYGEYQESVGVPKKKSLSSIILPIIGGVIALLLLVRIIPFIITVRNMRKVPLAPSECIGMDYRNVEKEFLDSGFTNVKTVDTPDLEFEDLSKEYLVTEVEISNETKFDLDSKFRKNESVIIWYSTAKMLQAPCNSKGAANITIDQAVRLFEKSGFRDIKKVKTEYKRGFSFVDKTGKVSSISINDSDSFKEKDVFRVDAKVEITYYASEESGEEEKEEPQQQDQNLQDMDPEKDGETRKQKGDTDRKDGDGTELQSTTETNADRNEGDGTVEQGESMEQEESKTN